MDNDRDQAGNSKNPYEVPGHALEDLLSPCVRLVSEYVHQSAEYTKHCVASSTNVLHLTRDEIVLSIPEPSRLETGSFK